MKRNVETVRGELIALWHISQEVQTLINDTHNFLVARGTPLPAPGEPRAGHTCDWWRYEQLMKVTNLLFALRQDVAKELKAVAGEEGQKLDEG